MEGKIKIVDLKDELSDIDDVNNYFNIHCKNSTIEEAIWDWTESKIDDRWQELGDWAISNPSVVDDYVKASGYYGFF